MGVSVEKKFDADLAYEVRVNVQAGRLSNDIGDGPIEPLLGHRRAVHARKQPSRRIIGESRSVSLEIEPKELR